MLVSSYGWKRNKNKSSEVNMLLSLLLQVRIDGSRCGRAPRTNEFTYYRVIKGVKIICMYSIKVSCQMLAKVRSYIVIQFLI